MEFKELNYLIVLAEEGNISRAADKLFMAQSSLSHFIKQVEAELHTTIFVRTSRGIRLTPSGEVLVSHARKMLWEYQAAQNEISDMEDMQTGTIRLGISTFRGTYILPPTLRKFHQRYPGVSVEITEADSFKLEEMIMKNQLDMALIALPPKFLENPPIDICIKDEVCLIANPDHPIIQRASTRGASPRLWVEPADLMDFTFIFSGNHQILGRLARQLFRQYGAMPSKIYPTDVSPLLATALVRSGIGVALSYHSSCQLYPDLLYLSIAPERIFVDLALVYPSHGYRSQACKALSACFHEYHAFD